uniref:Uncharacterized protein n=1 Tax=Arundo donax TaxID=35708 RepID=A0A0A9D4K5_ARUDO
MFDPGTLVMDNTGEMQNCPVNHQSKHEPVSGVNLGVTAVAENLLEDGHDDVLQICTSSEGDGGMSQANLCDHSQTCHNGHSVNLTSLNLSGADESLINAKKVFQKRRNSEDGITALDGMCLSPFVFVQLLFLILCPL